METGICKYYMFMYNGKHTLDKFCYRFFWYAIIHGTQANPAKQPTNSNNKWQNKII